MKRSYTTNHKIFLSFLFLFTLNLLSGQVYFNATDDESDYFIDVRWALPADPCLLDENGDLHSEVTTRILRDGQEIDYQTLGIQALQDLNQPFLPNLERHMDEDFVDLSSFAADPTIQSIRNYTFEFWAKRILASSFGLAEDLLVFGNDAVYINSAKELVYGTEIVPFTFEDGTNYHFAFVADQNSNTTEIFINGLPVATVDTYFSLANLTKYTSGNRQESSQALSDFKIWDVKRNFAQIMANQSFTGPANEDRLVVYFKVGRRGFRSQDLATAYDGVSQFNYTAGEDDTRPFNNLQSRFMSLVGEFRDFVGKDKNHTYTINVFAGPFGQIDHDCTRNDPGSTSMEKAPTNMMVSTDQLDRINISWTNESDLATGYKLFRDDGSGPVLIHTISNNINSAPKFTYIDKFDETSSIGIESGKAYVYTLTMESSHVNESWNYTIGTGQTIDVDFDATKSLEEVVKLTWNNNAAPLIDEYKVNRKNRFFSLRNKSETIFDDLQPHFGDSIVYELELVVQDTVRARFEDKGFAPANGSISGRVVTEEGLFPVDSVSVLITRLSTGETDSVQTNVSGFFEFTPIAYGLLDSFELSASKANHEFSYPTKTVGVNANNRAIENLVIFSDFDYNPSGNTNQVISFTAAGDANKDQVILNWELNTNASAAFVDVIRDGVVIHNEEISQGGSATSNFIDRTGKPNEETNYQIRIYNFNNGQISTASQDTTLIFPDVSKILNGGLALNPNNGIVQYLFVHNSPNVDGYRIYRNDKLIAEHDLVNTLYDDIEAPFDTPLEYSITAIRILNGVTYETKIPTAAPIINLGSMPVPTNLRVYGFDGVSYLDWDPPSNLPAGFNFTGYFVYRNNILIGKVPKSFNRFAEDYEGWGNVNTYSVSLFRTHENGYLESERISEDPENFPDLEIEPLAAYDFDVFPALFDDRIFIRWTAEMSVGSPINIDGFVLKYNGDEVQRLEAEQREFTHFPDASNSTHSYELAYYKTFNGVDYFGPFVSKSVSKTIANNPVYSPTEFTVSRTLPNQINLSWEYLDFIEAEFEIFKEDSLIVTLPVGSRSFYDHNPENLGFFQSKDDIHYQVRAKVNDQVSNKIGASGDVLEPRKIYGFVKDVNTGQGLANIPVAFHVLKSDKFRAVTDSAGYYSFNFNVESIIDMKVSIFLAGIQQTKTISTSDGAGEYRADFNINIPTEINHTKDARINYMDVDINPYNFHGHVYWNASNDNYDGIELTREIEVVATMPKSAGNLFIDSLAVPGISYIYQIRTYKDGPQGRVFSEFSENAIGIGNYPAIAPVINLSATPLPKFNKVQIGWSQLYDHADGYLVDRNGVNLGNIEKNNPFLFIDSTGVAGEEYTYTLRAYKTIQNRVYYSSEENVTLLYPAPASVSDVKIEIPILTNQLISTDFFNGEFYENISRNQVELSWNYQGSNASEFKISRDDDIIAVIPADSLRFIDSFGNPNENHSYGVSAVVNQNGVLNESEKVEVDTLFPELARPIELESITRQDVGDVVMNWKYTTPDLIDGFRVRIIEFSSALGYDTLKVVNLPAAESAVFVDDVTAYDPTGLKVVIFQVAAYTERNGTNYFSENTAILYTFPNLPSLQNCSATAGTFDRAIEVSWEYAAEANVDSFEITRLGVANIPSSITRVSKTSRSFLDIFNDNPEAISIEYGIKAFRNIEGARVYGPMCNVIGEINLDEVLSQPLFESHSIAIDGEWMVIGIPEANSGAGLVQLYKFENGDWSLQQTIVPPAGTTNNAQFTYGNFGISVDISNQVLVIGEPGYSEMPCASVIPFNSCPLSFRGRIVLYELNGDDWELDNFVGTFDRSFEGIPVQVGWSVAVDGNYFASSTGTVAPSNSPFNFLSYRNGVKVYKKGAGGYSQLNTNISNYNNLFDHYLNGNFRTVDMDNGNIVVGVPEGYYNGEERGFAMTYKLESDTAFLTDVITPQVTPSNGAFGSDVQIQDDVMLIASVAGNNNNVGTVTNYKYDGTDWTQLEVLTSNDPQSWHGFGQSISLYNDYLAVSEIKEQGTYQGQLFLYKKNDIGKFDLIQSPDSGDALFRKEFKNEVYSAGPPVNSKYDRLFGIDLALSDFHLLSTGYDQNTGDGNLYSLDLFKIKIDNLEGTDGTLNDTRISWDLGGCFECPDDYIEKYFIYRDGELIGEVDGTITQFFDAADDLISGASQALKGKKYVYEVNAKINSPFENISEKFADEGFSKRQGQFAGKVFVQGTNTPVPGVSLTLNGIDTIENIEYNYSTITDVDGSYSFTEVYVGTGISYTASPSYLDHEFEASESDTYILRPDEPTKSNVLFLDKTAYAITGMVSSLNSSCGLEGIKVRYYNTINGIETLVDSAITTQTGEYSMIVMPFLENLSEMRLKVENIQEQIVMGDTVTLQYNFAASEVVYTDFIDFPTISTFDFVDELTYPIQLRVVNACDNPVADQAIELRIGSLDGCYEFTVETNASGIATVNLAPKEYIFAVNEIMGSGVSNYENGAIDYLKLRPVTFDLLAAHTAAGAGTLPTIEPIRFVYHRAVNVAYTSTFERFDCNNPGVAILVQGNRHFMNFELTEDHRLGESCSVDEGYLIIRNDAAVKEEDTLYYNNGRFETYRFQVGGPNLVPPHALGMSLQYYSNQGSLLKTELFTYLVEGQQQLPGTGVITDALQDDNEVLQMPLMVLRDPPGDGSFSSIESGTTITKTLSIDREDSGGAGLVLDGSISVAGIGGFGELMTGGGQGNEKGTSMDFSFTTAQTFSTSDSEDAIGRGADVIVGTGLSNLFGISQILTFDEVDCSPNSVKEITFGISGFESTYGYTVDFIEGLIEGFTNDSIRVENDLITLIRPDGSIFSKIEARVYHEAKIRSWRQMLHYHDVETVPHYVLCSDFSYRDGDLSDEAVGYYDQWRNGFCNRIGYYDNGKFIMNENIEWTPSLVDAYNNTIAFTDEIKGFFLNDITNSDLQLSNKEIDDNNLSVTTQFHNTLGNQMKSAEIFDLSGNVSLDRTVTTRQSSSTSTAFSRFFTMEGAAGLYVDVENQAGLAYMFKTFAISGKVGGYWQADAKLSVSKEQAEENETTISYHIFDDDPEDQIAFIALQAPLQDQTPYFIRLGGLSSCPMEEALTINQDNDPLPLDNPKISVIISENPVTTTSSPPPQYEVPLGERAIFQVQLSQDLAPTDQTRDFKVFLDLESNPNGAIIRLGGSDLNIVSPTFSIPANASILQSLTVERPSGTPFYNFEGLRIGMQPDCGGEASYINLDVYFKSECSQVSLSKPFDGMIINRIDPSSVNDREVIPFEIRDYDSSNENLQYIQLQYKRLGSGQDWKEVNGGLFQRDVLVASDNLLALSQDPLYFFPWDITGQYNLYPDGEYMLRALAFCGVNGIQYSNETQITLSRSDLIIAGNPEPSDGIWTLGDEISSTYNTDLDCNVLNSTNSIENFISLIDLNTMTAVPFTHSCQNNKLTLTPMNPMSDYDGKMLRVSYTGILTPDQSLANDLVWDFEVVTQEVDWQEEIIEITMFQDEVMTLSTTIFNTQGTSVNNLSLAGSQTWLTTNPAINSNFNIPATGRNVDLIFDTNGLGIGDYTNVLTINGLNGRTPSINVKLTVIQKIPDVVINPTLTDSMTLVVNWSFLDPYAPSADVNDVIQVYKDGQLRGSAMLQEQGSFYYARITIYGDASDEDGLLDFVIWDASSSQAYTPIPFTATNAITFAANTNRGVLSNPEILLVDDDTFQFRGLIYVDSSNVNATTHDGLTWETAFLTLEEGIAAANSADSIWVAKGTYFPTSSNSRDASYIVDKNIAIIAGFQNGMTQISQRTGMDETILSGNIGFALDSTDNTYHVMKTTGTDILIDQVTFASGTANGTGDDDKGGCLYNTGSITLKDCKMQRGAATNKGGLIYNDGNIILDGGTFLIPSISSVSNLHNETGSTITIQKNVRIEKE